ncbi:MAG: MFS transporter [Propionibacteriaceae bacterium]|nr:MFS transporter [Propionibacteriaceae bacterium]
MSRIGRQIGQTFASLRFFNYRVWFATALVSNVGAWMQRIAQDWLVLKEMAPADPGLAAGIVTALQFLPALFLSAYAGLLADRLPSRPLLIATQTGQGILAVVLGVLVLSGHAQLWHVYLLAFLLGCVTAIDAPVRQTFVAEMVPMTMLTNAVGLNSASFNTSRLIGPAIAGLLIQVAGSGWAFIINGVTFAATIVGLVIMRKSELYPVEPVKRGKGQIREAVGYVAHRPDIVLILIVIGVISCLGFNSQLTIGLMATQVFDRQAGDYGVLSSMFAVGSLIGALLAAHRQRPRIRMVVVSAFGFGIFSGLSALMPTYWTFGLSGIFVGLCTLTLITTANATIQLTTIPAMRGRVIALYMLIFQGATPIGSPLVGWLAGVWGARWSIGVGAIAALVVATFALWWNHKYWHVTLRIEHQEGFPPRIVIDNPLDSVRH